MKIKELLREFTDPEGQYTTTAAPNNDSNPKRGFAVRVLGKFPQNYGAEDLWQALQKILPRDYPNADFQDQDRQVTPQLRVLQTVSRQGSAIVKTGIPSKDMAETIAYKFEQFPLRYSRPNGRIQAEVIELDNE